MVGGHYTYRNKHLYFVVSDHRRQIGSGATKEGQEDSTEENRIGGWTGQEGERRKIYSAAVIDGIDDHSGNKYCNTFLCYPRFESRNACFLYF